MSGMKIEKITPAIGALITGIDPGAPLSAHDADALYDALYDALIAHQVIFFRGTDITPAAHMALAQSFGDLDAPHPIYPHVAGHDRIVELKNDSSAPPDTNSWHTDLTFKAQQPFASILIAREVPDVGGDTMWSSNYAAYDRLPPGMRADLEGLNALHDMGDFRNNFGQNAQAMTDAMSRFGHATRPLIDTHPVTGRKFLNFNEAFVTHIMGLTTNAANALKTWLANHMNTPEDQMRWRWQAGDLAMWDNRATMHYAVADYLPAKRCMHRITVIKDARSS